jgi:hypothetical protein
MSAIAIQNILPTLARAARNSELLQPHAATLTRSGYRPAMPPTRNYNHYTSCHYSKDKPSAHAEKVALTKFRRYYQSRNASDAKIRRKLRKTTIIVARLNPSVRSYPNQHDNHLHDNHLNDNHLHDNHLHDNHLHDAHRHDPSHIHQFKNSAPCYHCLALLKDYGVRKVVFTTDYGEPQREKGVSIR